jgi:hypothetical protein
MSTTEEDAKFQQCVDDLLRSFRQYDRVVDIVSIFEMLFTASETAVPETVAHFERVPRIPQPGDENALTPEFTVVFNDQTGLIGEVSNVALAPQSVDDLCRQLAKYDGVTELPLAEGTQPVNHVDVMVLIPADVAMRAVHELFDDRLLDDDHFYSPSTKPFVAQYVLQENRYVFQRMMHQENGSLLEEGRSDGIGRWLERNSINVRPERFMPTKIGRRFVNDSVDALYLAVHLWMRLIPGRVEGDDRPASITLSPVDIASDLRKGGASVRASDVRRALELLARAKLAYKQSDDSWLVAWEELRSRQGERRGEVLIARLVCRPPSSGARARLTAAQRRAQAAPPPPRLFEL